MHSVQIVGVELPSLFDNSTRVYHFKNAHEFKIKIGNQVVCKVGTGGTVIGTVVTVDEVLEEKMQYKNIVEVIGMKKEQMPLQDGNEYVCDIRIWRNQWSTDGGYEYQWSDLIKTCLYDQSENLSIGSVVNYQDTEGKVVNLRQVPKKKTLKMETVQMKQLPPKKQGFFSRLFSK
ncbi:small nuclear ribonucleoprotein (snRNP)-like protein [Paenibacillus sp. LBL]|uniref:hypothetical protein n=1 Tax=Paenibacillus sp. LBL TaxID=2940563 RepID=UPI0024745E95|nr:hypothetical protein [Paenibacillus sp. LBL]MDH6674361.1 small nuclear ribonucleoprotein (snRNP)-like protein [Paenibacillus sp. LBL]